MDLQTIFYIVGIVAMVLFIVLMFIAIYFILFVKSVISRTEKRVVNTIIEYTKPVDILKNMANNVAGNIVLQVGKKLGITK